MLKKTIEQTISEAMSEMGRRRWQGVSAEDRAEYGRRISRLRWDRPRTPVVVDPVTTPAKTE